MRKVGRLMLYHSPRESSPPNYVKFSGTWILDTTMVTITMMMTTTVTAIATMVRRWCDDAGDDAGDDECEVVLKDI
ncbi:hypothetical protein Glove_87g33 [Diversispora epigaea]|uniref:Uncharacterized protein n=1 Tax=Diversispora epigaea TaxID=1348612 RepID=A0A397J8L2_9GLOM|nr:hypothetical protein Glove_87g33 [Diversispora epigaea]